MVPTLNVCRTFFLLRHAMAAALAFAGVGSLAPAATGTPAPIASEPEVKAAALYNIIAFTDWPPTCFASSAAPLVIGVVGQEPVAEFLDSMLGRETWHGRRMLLRRIVAPADARACHVIYVGSSEYARWRALNGPLAGLPILTVGDAENFAQQGGMVQLAIERNRLRLIVNLSAARASGVVISSKVLRLAQVIDDRKP